MQEDGKQHGTGDTSGADSVATSQVQGVDFEQAQDDTVQEASSMSLIEHLQELRYRLTIMVILIIVGVFVAYPFAEHLFAFVVQPLVQQLPEGKKLVFTALPEAFFVYLKLSLLASVFATSPLTFYQLWAFVAPGLFKEERHYVLLIALCSTLGLVAGGAFCYYEVFPIAFRFFLSFSNAYIEAMPSLTSFLDFALKLLLAFGLIAQMPLAAFFLGRFGIITVALLKKWQKYFILIAFVMAALLTPPDIFSQILMAIPMILLYEISIVIVYFCERARKKRNATEC